MIFLGIYRRKTGKWFWENWKKWIKLTVGSLFFCGALISIINLIFICTPKLADISEDSDYVILLGGGISKDGTLPAPVLNRVEKAGEYLLNHPETVCVVTGGTLKWLPYAEAPEIKRQLVLKGIEPERVLVEDQALDTIQNLQFSCKVISDFEGIEVSEVLNSRVVVISNRFHLRRAERLARRIGYKNVKGISGNTSAIYIPHNYLREICAYVKLNLRILFTGEPGNLLSQCN